MFPDSSVSMCSSRFVLLIWVRSVEASNFRVQASSFVNSFPVRWLHRLHSSICVIAALQVAFEYCVFMFELLHGGNSEHILPFVHQLAVIIASASKHPAFTGVYAPTVSSFLFFTVTYSTSRLLLLRNCRRALLSLTTAAKACSMTLSLLCSVAEYLYLM